MTERRVRFLVERVSMKPPYIIQRKEVLGQNHPSTPDRIRILLSDGDWIVTKVTKKARTARGSAIKKAKARWKLDERNFERAKEQLGIQLPVRVKVTGRAGGRYGAHWLRRATDKPRGIDPLPWGTSLYHHITVKDWMTPSEAGETLWHELRHAEQAERAINELLKKNPHATMYDKEVAWNKSYDRGIVEGRKRRLSYAKQPCEIEATATEINNIILPLARRNS